MRVDAEEVRRRIPVEGPRFHRGVRLVVRIVAALVLSSSIVDAQQCVGDCDANGSVTVNELIRCVRIALGQDAVDSCMECDRNGDGSVRIPELVTAVSHALCACETCPTPVPTRTPSFTPTSPLPTATQTSPVATQLPATASDGGVLYGERCLDCHDKDGSDIVDPSAASISAAIEDPATRMGAFRGVFSASQIEAMSSFLTTSMHSNNWDSRRNHGGFVEDEGVGNCQECHGGPDLMGEGAALSCFTCHGKEW